MKEEAERIQESLTAEETAARQTAHDMILKTAHELSVRGAARRWEITHKMNERFNALDHRILERKATLMGDVETLSSALTKEIVAKIIGQTADHDDVRRVVAASFDQRSGT